MFRETFATRGELFFIKKKKKKNLYLILTFYSKIKKKIKKIIYLLGFTGVPKTTNLHLLFGIFCFTKTTCSYSSLLQVFARVEQQIKTPLRCTPLRPSFHSGEIFYSVKNSRVLRLVPFRSFNRDVK